MYKNLKAFTIIDLVVALIISSIIIGMAYFTLSLFNKGFINYQKKVSALNAFYFFERTWKHDWEKAQYIKSEGNTSFVLSYRDTLVTYHIQDSSLIRVTAISSDTLPVRIANSDIHLYHDTLNIVDQLEYDVLIEGEVIPCIYHKYYAAKDLLQLKNQ